MNLFQNNYLINLKLLLLNLILILLGLIDFYQNQIFNLEKQIKVLIDRKEEDKMAHLILDIIDISKEYNYLNFFLDKTRKDVDSKKIKKMFNTLVDTMKFICDSTKHNE